MDVGAEHTGTCSLRVCQWGPLREFTSDASKKDHSVGLRLWPAAHRGCGREHAIKYFDTFDHIDRSDGVPNWQDVARLITEWQPTQLVVGEPLNMDGTDSDMAVNARRFSRRLAERFALPCELIDERLSSEEANELRG